MLWSYVDGFFLEREMLQREDVEKMKTRYMYDIIFCRKSYRLWDSFISIQPWRPGLAGTRAQSCDRYGSGTLHPGQLLGGSLPLLSPAFRRSHFSRNDTRDPSSKRWNCGRERCLIVILPKFWLPHTFRDLLHAANLRHGTDGFTSPPKEGVLRIFSP